MTAELVPCPVCHGTGKILLSWHEPDPGCTLCARTGQIWYDDNNTELVPWAVEHPEDAIRPRHEAMDPRLRGS